MQEWAQDKIPGSLSGREKGEEIVVIYSFQAEYGGAFYVSFPISGSGVVCTIGLISLFRLFIEVVTLVCYLNWDGKRLFDQKIFDFCYF